MTTLTQTWSQGRRERSMRRRSPLVILAGVVMALLVLFNIKFTLKDVNRFKSNVMSIISEGDDFNDQKLMVQAERWIVLDATDIPINLVLDMGDVPGWRILVFGQNIWFFKSRRCNDCVFINDQSNINTALPLSAVKNIRMTSYLFAISHGAKWIYSTDRITDLHEQLYGFQFEERSNGMMYRGDIVFDPDRHFGVKDMSTDTQDRNRHVSYQSGEFLTPSIQTKWTPPLQTSFPPYFDVQNAACRLPHAYVPAYLYKSTDLSSSLVGYTSFWALGSILVKESSSSWTNWWRWLMTDLHEVIGIYPQSCTQTFTYASTEGSGGNENDIVEALLGGFKCGPQDTFNACALKLTNIMVTHKLLKHSDSDIIKSWFSSLGALSYLEPKRNLSSPMFIPKDPPQMIHNVVYEPTAKRLSQVETNPYKDICKSKLPRPSVTTPPVINDIVLVVIFNYPTYYSNILQLDYVYRKFFKHIVYCGSVLGNFGGFQKQYQHPVTFLEVNEIDQGVHGYLCAAYAMELGFNVSGYMQMSDDVLLNMWNIVDLPRDKIWFQQSIRNGTLGTKKVPNITKTNGQWHWWPWSSGPWGVKRLRQLWAYFDHLKTTSHKQKVQNFLSKLSDSFGGPGGAFYEASDIYYVPSKHKELFSFFSKLFVGHHVFLEIAIPTMLCGFDHISNIVRLNGTYLWYQERVLYEERYTPNNMFLHSWKLKPLMTETKAQDFYCTKYLPYVEGKATHKPAST